MKNKISTLSIFSALFLTACATSHVEERTSREPANVVPDCFQAIEGFIKPKIATANPNVKGIKRYSKGFENIEGANIQYGYESEYRREETEAILKNYMPTDYGNKEGWLSLSHHERLEYIDRNIALIFPHNKKGNFIKIASDIELSDALPDTFSFDYGQFEIVLDPMDTAEELIQKIKVINKHFGVGSMQLMISNPIDKKLLKLSAYLREKMKVELLGYYNFINDLDTLTKLSTGHDRYLQDPTALTAKSFNHPWLGPMTELKHTKLRDLINGIVEQYNYHDVELRNMSTRITSHKFTGGLAFRPDIGYKHNRLASEVRDCHKNLKCLEEKLIRETYILMKGRHDFAVYKDFAPFDAIHVFEQEIPHDSKVMLSSLFPSHAQSLQPDLQIFRNFSYPLRNWKKHIEVLEMPELTLKVANAQKAYVKALKAIDTEYSANHITKEAAQAKVMGALGAFSKESGLLEAMKTKAAQLIDSGEIEQLQMPKLTTFLRHQINNLTIFA